MIWELLAEWQAQLEQIAPSSNNVAAAPTGSSGQAPFKPDDESYFESIAKAIPDIPVFGNVCSCKRPRDGSLCVIS